MSFRWLRSYSDTTYPYGGGSNLGTFGYIQNNPQTLTGLSFTHLFTPVMINEARFGFSLQPNVGQLGYHAGTDYNAKLLGFSPGRPSEAYRLPQDRHHELRAAGR